ncbi:hypothetical protein T4C_13290 [Trichinella pseudospiralis]|uniref:Uncharacterized protein n=1 Tax=Trichinella pseudospiralis TaxID=6337 RepID=A0A0V1K5Q5_TRIPS|nr:hypothetical protein T4C_13290 [Trichinella pseudospiralis]
MQDDEFKLLYCILGGVLLMWVKRRKQRLVFFSDYSVSVLLFDEARALLGAIISLDRSMSTAIA